MAGIFITFESIDGVGKTTQVKLLAEALQAYGPDVLLTKEPGDQFMGPKTGPGIRKLLFEEPSMHRMHPGVKDLLFLADHIQNAGDVANAIAGGKIVICDRYADSQAAYAQDDSPEWAHELYANHYGPIPDIKVHLIARGSVQPDGFEDISWAMRRAKGRKGSEEGKQDGKLWNDMQQVIQDRYSRVLHRHGSERVLEIHVTEDMSVLQVHDTILRAVLQRISEIRRLWTIAA